jgi:hypothetical protein
LLTTHAPNPRLRRSPVAPIGESERLNPLP